MIAFSCAIKSAISNRDGYNKWPMQPAPRVLLSIDYEPWFALVRRFDRVRDPQARCDLDGGFVLHALDPILEMLGDAQASFYLVGEIAGWYPHLPQKILDAGHELGLHCQYHRSLIDVAELADDLRTSQDWRRHYTLRGFRAPMVGISEEAYPLLKQAGFVYSSSMYAPAGTLLQKEGVWEVPVSTLPLFGSPQSILDAPRAFSFELMLRGEIPYGSSLTIGLLNDVVLRIVEKQLRAGLSPVIFLHPYELVKPDDWPGRIRWDLLTHPQLLPFTANKSRFLAKLLRNFPVSTLGSYVDEVIALQEPAYA